MEFATLTPANVLAKMAFSDAFNAIMSSGQKESIDVARCHMNVQPNLVYEADVLRYRLELERKLSEEDDSESLTELNTDHEEEDRNRGMVWNGFYVLGFQHPPSTPDLGWIIGKKGSYADIVLCSSAFAKRHSLNLRNSHARLNFNRYNGAIFISAISSSPLSGVTVNGEAVSRQTYILNQYKMKIGVNLLEYDFEYTEFASTKDYKMERQQYLASELKAPTTFLMPTPQQNTRTIGQWTLSDPLGKGTSGRVFLASNSKNETVAIKMIEYTSRTAETVNREIAQCEKLTALARTQNAGERLVHLTEVIREQRSSSGAAFEDVALVLEPMTPQVLDRIVGFRSMGLVLNIK